MRDRKEGNIFWSFSALLLSSAPWASGSSAEMAPLPSSLPGTGRCCPARTPGSPVWSAPSRCLCGPLGGPVHPICPRACSARLEESHCLPGLVPCFVLPHVSDLLL